MVGLLCLFIAYNHNSSQTYIFKGQAYGTSWTVTTTSYLNDTHKSSIKKIINRVDYVASNYKENSEIALINLLGDSQEINISLDLYEILDIANKITLLTDGAYDIKLGNTLVVLVLLHHLTRIYRHLEIPRSLLINLI